MDYKYIIIVLIILTAILLLSKCKTVRDLVKDLMSIDEERVSVLAYMTIATLLFSFYMCFKLKDIPANLTGILQTLIVCMASVSGSYILGSSIQKITKIKNEIIRGNIAGAVEDIKSGLEEDNPTV